MHEITVIKNSRDRRDMAANSYEIFQPPAFSISSENHLIFMLYRSETIYLSNADVAAAVEVVHFILPDSPPLSSSGLWIFSA